MLVGHGGVGIVGREEGGGKLGEVKHFDKRRTLPKVNKLTLLHEENMLYALYRVINTRNISYLSH